MAGRPIASTSREGRPRTRSQSMHLSSCIPVTPRAEGHRTTSKQRTLTKGKGAGKGKKASKKSNKQIEVVSSDSEDLEVDFPNYHPNQPHKVPAEIPQEPQPTCQSSNTGTTRTGAPHRHSHWRNTSAHECSSRRCRRTTKFQSNTHTATCINGKQSVKLVSF